MMPLLLSRIANMVGGRVRGAATPGRTELDGRLDVRGVVQNTFVDYRWEIDGEARARVRLRPLRAGPG